MATVGQQLSHPESGWKRYDDNVVGFKYIGSGWKLGTSSNGSVNEYSQTQHFTNVVGDKVAFEFSGTKLRVIAQRNTNRSTVVDIVLDGVTYTYSENGSLQSQTLLFEKTDLPSGVHTAEIKHGTGGSQYISLDAIDIDDTGSIKLPLGVQLTSPDPGWKRYEPNAGCFKVDGSGWASNSGFDYGTATFNGAKFSFLVTNTTSLRVLTYPAANRADQKIRFNGGAYTEYDNNALPSAPNMLAFERIDLDPNQTYLIEVEPVSGSGAWFGIDAIDIMTSGRIYRPDEVTNVKDLSVGKRIRFNYLAFNAAYGVFSLGEEVGSFLPIVPAASANGDGYFIMVDTTYKGDKILIADRNIQNLSWDALNTAGVASGSGLPIKELHTIPAMSGYSSPTCTVSASTEFDQTNHNAWKAFDVSSTSYWTSTSATATTEEVLKIQYVSPVKITSYQLHAKYGPKQWAFEASNDGIVWDILHSGNEKTAWNETIKTFSFNNDKTYSQYRIRVLERHVWSSTYYYIGFYTVQLFTSPEQEMTMRLLTGGVSPTDKDNEWDKYMTDDQIWNNVNHGSWTSTTDQSNSKARVIRGYNGLTNWTSGTTELTTPGRGFRPVLLIEPINNNRFLILDGADVKTYTSSGWETVGSTPPTDDMFLNKGMLDLSICAPYLKDLIDKSNIKILVSKPKREHTVAHLTGVPVPRIVKMKNDVSFLSTSKINSLTLSGTEQGVLRVAISMDSGATWEAKQKDGSWTTVSVTTPINFKAKAMTIDDFNSISEWDEKIGQARNLRCAFYFEQSSSTDKTSLDSLTMDVDLLDSWDMAMPGVDYKYEYNRNTNLRVLLLSDGDYKINVGTGGSSGSTITEVDGGTF
ncbi:hypothetical protein LOY85_03150 [Brevibacillus brevis]|uniref:hypothetical protein n=1 Tax=Brevibacillus brevis TaxID=1393 RepID=UPI001F48EE51|nr:hypothetical protein [Brevibacillus brevis]UIO43165.1 hypothetical protein LOY85_03150 [Brevibacillus brevis]